MGRLKDALKPSNIWSGTQFSGLNEDLNENDTPPSRLLNNSNELRNSLKSRNLYTEFTQYPLQPNDRERIVNAVSGILNGITPFNSTNLNNTAIGRLISTPTTPLTDIGLLMLGKQFTQNFKSNAIQQLIPSINLRNAFDGNSDTKLFQENINFSITEREDAGNFQNFLEDFFGYNPNRENPFRKNASNAEYLQNTGVGQLDFLFGNGAKDDTGGLNKNIYKPYKVEYFNAAERSKNNIASRESSLSGKEWFNFTNYDFYKYLTISTDFNSESRANSEMEDGYITSTPAEVEDLRNQEYAPSLDYINEYFGRTKNARLFNLVNDLEERPETEFDDNIKNRLVWGRDGISAKANERISKLRGVNVPSFDLQDTKFNYNIYTGLLEYTRNLLNATEGQLIDQTRKIYKNGKNIDSANGSKLWKAPESSLNRFAGRKGIRQHSVLDQYDRFAKAIRFDGNEVYGGNENSVINKSVLPKIHPILDNEGNVDNTNLMFSLENLAVVAIDGDGEYGIIDDEYGTQIPSCEVGPFNGRMMWFPPYAISLNETASANFEPTVMVGRNEPIYTYMHSERSAVLTFTMIADYPEQLKNYIKDGEYKDIGEFFAFGGPEFEQPSFLNNPEEKQRKNEEEITKIEGPNKKLKTPLNLTAFNISFPNDIPAKNNTDASVIDKLYLDYKYEIVEGLNSVIGTSHGLNSDIYILKGVNLDSIPPVFNPPEGFSQSNAEYIETDRVLDDTLRDAFNDPENVNFYEIDIVGGATALYTPSIKDDEDDAEAYNKSIGLRRAKVAESFIKARIKKIFPDTASEILDGLVFNIRSEGAPDQEYNTVESKNELGAKLQRSAKIEIVERETTPDPKEQNTTSDEERDINELKKENQGLQNAKNVQGKNSKSDCIMNEREASDISDNDDGIMGNGRSLLKNKFYPAFHSQTPEDLHKRLTFLQQCVRQGSAIRSTPEVDENGIRRVKNSVFGRQPVCILRIADFFYTKVIIESINIDYDDTVWDTNPEGFGMQPMIAYVTLNMKILGGQSLKGPIDALQNAVSFNYYANSTYTKNGLYKTPTKEAEKQETYINGVLDKKSQDAQDEFNNKTTESFLEDKTNRNIYNYNEDDRF
jgi:hypothetical protein